MNIEMTNKETTAIYKRALTAQFKASIHDQVHDEVGEMVDVWIKENRARLKAAVGKELEALFPVLIKQYMNDLKRNGFLNIEY